MCFSVGSRVFGGILLLFFSGLTANAQNFPADGEKTSVDSIIIEPVFVRAYFQKQPLMQSTASVALLGQSALRAQQGIHLVSALNTVPGVRMEERSPGSYRLSIRGSLLRSPFGIRNIKVYMDEMPLTDAGGNTYLNMLDPGAISTAEILKGPDGSLFGANSGGVVILRSAVDTSQQVGLQIQAGSFGLFHQKATLTHDLHPSYQMSWMQAYQKSKGYREHSALEKLYLQTRHQWSYHSEKTNRLILNAWYGDLDYQTPGGLTLEQYEQHPRSARQASPTIPNPIEQQAGIHNRTLQGGLTHEWMPLPKLKHSATVFGSYTDFRNPFITNYEERLECNQGFRTYLSYTSPLDKSRNGSKWIFQMQAGIEWQSGSYNIDNYDNNGGVQGNPQAIDQLYVHNGTSFMRMGLSFAEKWNLESALSHNSQKYSFKTLFPQLDRIQDHTIPSEWMPRLAVSYQPLHTLAFRALVSRGFSPPTTAEIRPSDNIINTDLHAEKGWNKELGLRVQNADRTFSMDVSLFQYRMSEAIVRGSRANGAEFFRNAGKIDQTGMELLANYWLLRPSAGQGGFGLHWTGSWTWSHFRFLDFQSNGMDFSGNVLTGVPAHTLHQSLRFLLLGEWEGWINYSYSSAIPLNDANTVQAEPYHLVQTKITWKTPLLFARNTEIMLFAGGDNLLNQQYSLGNDINAFGGRYFNTAPSRNFYAGLSLQF